MTAQQAVVAGGGGGLHVQLGGEAGESGELWSVGWAVGEARVEAGGAGGAGEEQDDEDDEDDEAENEPLALRRTNAARIAVAVPESAKPPPSDAPCRRGRSDKVAPPAVPVAPPAVPADKVESRAPCPEHWAEAAVAAVTGAAVEREAVRTDALRTEERAPPPAPPPVPVSKPAGVGLKQTGLLSFFGAPITSV